MDQDKLITIGVLNSWHFAWGALLCDHYWTTTGTFGTFSRFTNGSWEKIGDNYIVFDRPGNAYIDQYSYQLAPDGNPDWHNLDEDEVNLVRKSLRQLLMTHRPMVEPDFSLDEIGRADDLINDFGWVIPPEVL